MGTFKIIKKGTGNFWHVYNNNSKEVNLSDFEIVLDSFSQTFSIQMPNGSNVPSFSVDVFDIIVIDETDGSIEETFANVEVLRLRLIELGYTPYIGQTPSSEVKQYKFLLSQSGGDDPQTATSGSLTQGVTYEILSIETGDDFTPSGAPNNDVGTKWIANGTAPTWSNGSELGWNGGAPYIYAQISNYSSYPFWFTYQTTGLYFAEKTDSFDDTKTWYVINEQSDDVSDNIGKSRIKLQSGYLQITSIDTSGSLSNSILDRTPVLIEIKD